MPNAAAIIKKLDVVLRRYNLTSRPVYKRIITMSGGDPLIGRSSVVFHNDYLLDPQPQVVVIGPTNQLVAGSTTLLPEGSLLVTASPSSLSLADIENKALLIVLKQGAVEEEYFISGFNTNVFQGQVISYELVLRSKTYA